MDQSLGWSRPLYGLQTISARDREQRDLRWSFAPACRPERDAGENDPGDERQRAEQVKEERQLVHVSGA
jgi:hypothetical protein